MISIQEGTQEHLAQIADFQLAMARETENVELDLETVRAGVRGVLDKPERGFYLVAQDGQELRGCLLVLSEWSDWRCREVLWLHSVYVLPQHRRGAVFRSLYERVESLARARGAAGLRLYVDRRNVRAQQVYQALGMTNEHYELYEKML
jgi:GNAT superfamily N-acetyltransferase